MATFVKPNAAGAKTLASSWYISPDVFAAEQERIFAREWLCVGREEAIPQSGDFFTVERAGESLIVTRDAAGCVHAFFNVCRHRGTRICSVASGHFARLDPMSVPRVDLRTRRCAEGGAQHG